MLRLTISSSDVELYENAPVNLKLSYSDIEKINNPRGSFSQTFRVPLTNHNRTIFGNLDEPQEVGGLNLRQRLTASLHSDSTPILSGFVQVKAVYMTKEVFAEVELVFFSGALDLKTELGGAFISDLDLDTYDHDLTIANVQQSWTLFGTGPGPEIRYGIIDKGNNWSDTNPVSTSTDGLTLPELTPFIQAKVLVDKILAGAGFTYESTYLEGSDFEDVYLPAWNGSQQILPKDVVDNNVRATLATSQTITGGTSANLNVSDTQTGTADPSGNWNNTTDEYTAPFGGLYSLRLTYSWSFSGSSGATAAFVRVRRNTTILETYEITDFAGDKDNLLLTFDNIFLSSGDTLEVNVFNPNVGGGSITFGASANFNEGTRTSVEIVALTPLGDFEVGVAENLPELKQIDFLTSLQKMYNLVFIPDPNKPNHLAIETFADYTASGDNKDWTNKVDYTKDVNIKPTTDIQSQVYEWSHKEGQDFISLEVQRSLDRVYGRQRIVDTGNDFATGTLNIQTNFAPYILSNIPGTANPIFRGLTADGSGIKKPLPMLAYWCGLSTNLGTTYLTDEDNNTTSSVNTPFFSNYSSDDPQLTDKDLNFGVELPLHSIAINPRDTLYIRFWAQYVTELYSSDARTIACHVRLNEADLADLKFNDNIYINGAFYRLLSLSYDANEPTVAKCELILKLDDIAICADTPTSLRTSANEILFNDTTILDPDYGSQACCELYGYRWAPNKVTGDRCRPNNAQLEI